MAQIIETTGKILDDDGNVEYTTGGGVVTEEKPEIDPKAQVRATVYPEINEMADAQASDRKLAKWETQAIKRMNDVELRDYQIELHNRVIEAFLTYDRVVMQSPTGSGKTEIAVKEIQRRIEMGQKDAVFIVHRDVLERQAVARMAKYGIKAKHGSGRQSSWKPNNPRPSGVLAVCIQTVRRRLQKDPDALKGAFLVIDEMHFYPHGSNWGKVVAAHDSQVLGLSATIWRMGLEEKFEPTWQHLEVGLQTDELVDRGMLAPSLIIDIPSFIRGVPLTRKADIARSQDGFDHTATWEKIKSEVGGPGTLTKDAVAIWYAKANHAQTIVFALTVEHAYALERHFNALAGSPGMEDFNRYRPVARVSGGRDSDIRA